MFLCADVDERSMSYASVNVASNSLGSQIQIYKADPSPSAPILGPAALNPSAK